MVPIKTSAFCVNIPKIFFSEMITSIKLSLILIIIIRSGCQSVLREQEDIILRSLARRAWSSREKLTNPLSRRLSNKETWMRILMSRNSWIRWSETIKGELIIFNKINLNFQMISV